MKGVEMEKKEKRVGRSKRRGLILDRTTRPMMHHSRSLRSLMVMAVRRRHFDPLVRFSMCKRPKGVGLMRMIIAHWLER